MGYRISVEALDVTSQHAIRLRGVPAEQTVGDLVTTAVGRMGLPTMDPVGRPYSFMARRETTGEALFVSQAVGDVLEDGERIRVLPSVDAGSPSGFPATCRF
jgi:hypothetical protein